MGSVRLKNLDVTIDKRKVHFVIYVPDRFGHSRPLRITIFNKVIECWLVGDGIDIGYVVIYTEKNGVTIKNIKVFDG